MAPEYGATCGLFPIDAETLRYLELSGRPPEADPPGRGVRQGPGAVPRPRVARGRPIPTRSSSTSRRSSRAWPARDGRRTASRCTTPRRRSPRRSRSSSRPGPPRRRRQPVPRCRSWTARPNGGRDGRRRADRRGRRSPPITQRLGRHRRDHELHQHVEPLGDGRRRPAGQEGRRARARIQALGQGQPGARLEGRHRLPRRRRARRVPRPAPVQPGRLRLHDLHRQLRPAPLGHLRGDQPTTTWSPWPS